MKDQYVNDIDAAMFLGLSYQTLRNWRGIGMGPKYTKLGRSVRYQITDLKEYADERKLDPEKCE